MAMGVATRTTGMATVMGTGKMTSMTTTTAMGTTDSSF
jgi:hypothetical protein